MRVMLVVHGFPPSAQGGTEIYVAELAHTLSARFGDEVLVLAREADGSRPECSLRVERRPGFEVAWVNNTFRQVRSFPETYRNPEIGRLGARLADRFRPEVAHIHHLTCLSTDLVEAFARRGIPTLFTLNDYWVMCQRGQLLDLDYARCPGPWPQGCARCLHTDPGAAAERLSDLRGMCGRVTRFLAPSRTLRRRVLDFGFPSSRISLQEQGIDRARFRGPQRVPSPRLRLGFAGSLMVSKAPHLLLEAFARLPPGAATLHLFGALTAYHGEDGYRRRLEPLLTQPGVRHAGALDHERMPEALASIDVLVVPSVWIENAPFVIKEAFAAGAPVVASDLGGMAELVEHETSGLLFRPGDAADLERSLRRLLEEPGLLERLRGGIPPVRTIEDDAGWTRQLYATLRGEASPSMSPAP